MLEEYQTKGNNNNIPHTKIKKWLKDIVFYLVAFASSLTAIANHQKHLTDFFQLDLKLGVSLGFIITWLILLFPILLVVVLQTLKTTNRDTTNVSPNKNDSFLYSETVKYNEAVKWLKDVSFYLLALTASLVAIAEYQQKLTDFFQIHLKLGLSLGLVIAWLILLAPTLLVFIYRIAAKYPGISNRFITFLRTYSLLRTRLTDDIAHASFAGALLNNPLQIEVLHSPIIKNKELKPSADWLKQLDILRMQLVSFHQQSNIQLKQYHGSQFLKELETFKQQTLVENPSWRGYYLKAIELWLKVTNEQLNQLKLQALTHEPITANVYLSGEALNPEMHRAIFLGRDDLRDQFSHKVLTAAQMPMFLIQGQRRTGKTSLLNFLEPLLGAGFRVIKQDLQNAKFDSIPNWLTDLHQQVCQRLNLPEPQTLLSDNWLQCWQSVQTCLSQLNETNHYKLILAFDEYEAIHTLLQQDPAQGERLLAAMRSFSQSQNKVVFLFVGAALFSELEQPNWSKYFVQAQRFRVDYLKHDDAIRLITEPVKLNYPPTVCEQMFDLTQGHPALLQLLCSKMVDIANTENKKQMSQADLDAVVQEVSNERETSAILIFWKDFCSEPACKHTVKQILNGEIVESNQHLYRLEEHGFIVEQNGHWQMRVPLFTLWLKRFAERVL